MSAPRLTLHPGEHIGVLGTTGSGKTYFIRRNLLPAFPRVVVVDTEEGRDFPEKEFPLLDESPRRAVRQIAAGLDRFPMFHWAWRPEPPNLKERLDELCVALLYRGHDLLLYVDEVTDFSDANRIGPWHRTFIRKARKRRMTEVYSSQRAPGVNHWLLGNTPYKVFFYVTPDERTLLHRTFPTLDGPLSELHFKEYDYLVVQPDGGVTHVRPHA